MQLLRRGTHPRDHCCLLHRCSNAGGGLFRQSGIAHDLFGTEDGYVLPVQQLKENDELTQAFIRLYEKRDAIRGHLNELLPSYIARADEARNALEELANK